MEYISTLDYILHKPAKNRSKILYLDIKKYSPSYRLISSLSTYVNPNLYLEQNIYGDSIDFDKLYSSKPIEFFSEDVYKLLKDSLVVTYKKSQLSNTSFCYQIGKCGFSIDPNNFVDILSIDMYFHRRTLDGLKSVYSSKSVEYIDLFKSQLKYYDIDAETAKKSNEEVYYLDNNMISIVRSGELYWAKGNKEGVRVKDCPEYLDLVEKKRLFPLSVISKIKNFIKE